MAPSIDLPPPPERPELPPEVRIGDERELSITTEDGLSLEALEHLPVTAERTVVLCHPHPLYGGTMHNALVVVVAKRLRERGNERAGWLRMNYRGVGKSEGRYGGGKAEVSDVRAAIGEVRRRLPSAKVSVVGISFGTGVAYRAAVLEGGVERVSLVTPSPRMLKEGIGEFMGPVQIVAAENDELCTMEETEELTRQLGATLQVIPGAGHQFIRNRREVANLVVPFVAPELSP
jgi:alpha/beta superfamily hydrolase